MLQLERLIEVLARYDSRSLKEIVNVNHFNNILIASCCIFFKYMVINCRLKEMDDNKQTWDDQRQRSDFNNAAIPCQVLCGLIIATKLHGRRGVLTFVILISCFASELVLHVTRLIEGQKFASSNKLELDKEGSLSYYMLYFCSIQVFLLYFLICDIGMLEIAKNEMLNSNKALTSSLYCLILSSNQFLQGLLWERLFLYLKFNKILWIIADNVATAIALICLIFKARSEVKEFRKFKK